MTQQKHLISKLQKRLLLIGENYAYKSKHEQNEVDIIRLETELKIKTMSKSDEVQSTVYRLKVVTQKQKEKIKELHECKDTISDITELNQEIEELLLVLSILLK